MGKPFGLDKGELGPAQRLGFGEVFILAQLIHGLHEYSGAHIRHRPEGGQDRLGALALGQSAQALDLASVRAGFPQCCFAGREGEHFHPVEVIILLPDRGQAQGRAVAQQEI